MRRAAKRDGDEHLIVKALRDAGCTVIIVSHKGLPDLYVKNAGEWYWLEVKSPEGKLTRAQREMARHLDFTVVRTIKEAFDAVGVMLA